METKSDSGYGSSDGKYLKLLEQVERKESIKNGTRLLRKISQLEIQSLEIFWS